MRIRDAVAEDWSQIWPIWHTIVAAGTTYDWDPSTDEPTARGYWMKRPPGRVFVAELEGAVVGTATLAPNRLGLGSHIANASFMVDASQAGRGIGRRMAEHVLDEARRGGYHAMQFNAVVETNVGAIALYLSLGFQIIGTVPEAFRHAEEGMVGLHIMHRKL